MQNGCALLSRAMKVVEISSNITLMPASPVPQAKYMKYIRPLLIVNNDKLAWSDILL